MSEDLGGEPKLASICSTFLLSILFHVKYLCKFCILLYYKVEFVLISG